MVRKICQIPDQGYIAPMRNRVIMLAAALAVAVLAKVVMVGESTAQAADSKAIKHVNAKQAADLLKQSKGVVVLDIRTPDEFKAGHLEGAKNIDFRAADFEAQLGKLDKSKAYLLHCASGRRSTTSLKQFEKLGFQAVYHLDGGIKAWQQADLPVVK